MKKDKNSKKVFEQECITYMDNLYATALKMTRNTASAEELVQDTYVKAFRFRKSFTAGTNLKAWLFRILTNTFINGYRRSKNEQSYIERAAVEPLYDQILGSYARDYASSPEEHVFNKFFQEKLTQSLEQLPEDFRLAVTLSDVQGFSYKEISEILDKPMGTVMSRLHRGRKMLQHYLVDYAAAAGLGHPDAVKQKSEPVNILEYKNKKEGGL